MRASAARWSSLSRGAFPAIGNQPGRAMLIELKGPVPHDLKPDAANLCPFRPRGSIVDRSQSQQPARLPRVLCTSGLAAKHGSVKIGSKRDRHRQLQRIRDNESKLHQFGKPPKSLSQWEQVCRAARLKSQSADDWPYATEFAPSSAPSLGRRSSWELDSASRLVDCAGLRRCELGSVRQHRVHDIRETTRQSDSRLSHR